MRDVAEIVRTLEGRGMCFWCDPVGLRFDCESADLRPGDSRLVAELLERESETVLFVRRRATLLRFGQYAAAFRLAVYRFRTPAGMLPWLAERAPGLHAELTVRLPDALRRIWEEGGPMEEFRRAIRDLEEVRAAALGFYSACQPWTEERGAADGRRELR